MRTPSRLLLPVYTAAIFLSATLLFAVQPMFAKLVLPVLGGAPSVWSVAMVFFQGALLGGYAYAHALTRLLPPRLAVPVHLAVTIAATAFLPLAIASGWGRPPQQGEALWLIGLFAASIGLPFFALSANGPLLQAWFARTGHPDAADPYFLYAASNLGSFLALVSYPVAVEPFLRLGQQTTVWAVLFVALIGLIAACGLLVWRTRGTDRVLSGPAGGEAETAAPGLRDALVWIGLAAVPSGLLVAVTVHISTDVAAVPMMWVVPLALYLATFVMVFRTRFVLPHRWVVLLSPTVVLGLVGVMVFEYIGSLPLIVGLNLAAFFVMALVCHGELAQRRPAARHLTAFYLWMSAGGMVGGVFAGLVAPYAFSWVAEYPLLIVLAILCRPALAPVQRPAIRIAWSLALVAAVGAMVPGLLGLYVPDDNVFKGVVAALLAAALLESRNPVRFAAIVALTFVVGRVYQPDGGQRDTVRSFFGVHKIIDTSDGRFRVLQHGTTIHGAQKLREPDGRAADGRPEPLTYYHALSPMAETIRAVRKRAGGPIRVAVVGLGTGSLACQSSPGDDWTYYEIDRSVVTIAHDPARFTFLSQCAPGVKVVLGDARLTLAKTAARYDLIVVDAFSSDAIPVHLLTREAMAIYLARLAPQGAVLVHVSNRHMDLVPAVAGIAAANGLKAFVNTREEGTDDDEYRFGSTVVVSVRADDDLPAIADNETWEEKTPDPAERTWTDDFTNVLGAILRRWRE